MRTPLGYAPLCLACLLLFLATLRPAALYGQTQADMTCEVTAGDNVTVQADGTFAAPAGVQATLLYKVTNLGPQHGVGVWVGAFDASTIPIQAVTFDDGTACDEVTADFFRCKAPLNNGEMKVVHVAFEGVQEGTARPGFTCDGDPPGSDPDLNNNFPEVILEVGPALQRDLSLEMKIGHPQPFVTTFDNFVTTEEMVKHAVHEVRLRVTNVGTEAMSSGFTRSEFEPRDSFEMQPGFECHLPSLRSLECDLPSLQPNEQFTFAWWVVPQDRLVSTASSAITIPLDDNLSNSSVVDEIAVIEGKVVQVMNASPSGVRVTMQANTRSPFPVDSDEATPFLDLSGEEALTVEDPATGNVLATAPIDGLALGAHYAWLSDFDGTGLSFKFISDDLAGSETSYITVVNETDLADFQISWLNQGLNALGSPVEVPPGTAAQVTVPDEAVILRAGNVSQNRWGDYSGISDVAVFQQIWYFREGSAGPAGHKAEQEFEALVFDGFGTRIVPPEVTALDEPSEGPATLTLHENYPNPFNPTTTLRFDLPTPARVRVAVIDMLGRVALTVPPQHFEAGHGRTLTLNASSLPSGLYVYRLIAETPPHRMTATGRVVLLK